MEGMLSLTKFKSFAVNRLRALLRIQMKLGGRIQKLLKRKKSTENRQVFMANRKIKVSARPRKIK